MKRLFAILALTLMGFASTAQNWHCLQSAQKHFFVNSSYYLRGIRIDSVSQSGSDIIYYPFHTARNVHSLLQRDTAGGSWLGKKVIAHPEGTFLFDNLWQDTVVIKTLGAVGDSWVMYDDTSSRMYTAQITTADTLTVGGTVDSIKKIRISVFQNNTPLLTDPANNLEMIISKNNGFVQAIDLYTFPYHLPGSSYSANAHIDYYLDHFTSPLMPSTLVFHLIPFAVPTNLEIYDFNVGDAFNTFKSGHVNIQSFDTYSDIYYDSVVGKTWVTPYHVAYSTYQRYEHQYSGQAGSFSTYQATNSGFGGDSSKAFIMPLMPEEWRVGVYYEYRTISSGCLPQGRIYKISNDGGVSIGYEPFEYCAFSDTYTTGLGHAKHSCLSLDQADYYSMTYDVRFGYLQKGGVPCGQAVLPTAVRDVSDKVEVRAFPNPVSDVLRISIANKAHHLYIITLLNFLGSRLKSVATSNETEMLNVSGYPNGVYHLIVSDENGARGIFRVVINH